jgi:hypothetical protein
LAHPTRRQRIPSFRIESAFWREQTIQTGRKFPVFAKSSIGTRLASGKRLPASLFSVGLLPTMTASEILPTSLLKPAASDVLIILEGQS